jgi:multiple sugar transport system substrate-binding protein
MGSQRFGPAPLTRRTFLGSAASAAAGVYGLSLGLPRQATAATRVMNFQTVSDFTPASDVMLKKQTAEFNKRNKGIEVELEFISLNDRLAKIAAAVEANSGPDLLYFSYGEARLYEHSLRTVDDLCNRLSAKYGEWSPAIKAANLMNGHWKAVGWNHVPNGPTYREDILAKAGWNTFPDTYDELLRCAKDLKKNHLPPVALTLGHAIGDAIVIAYACLWSFGGKEVEEDGKTVAINSKETEAAVEYMKELYQYMDPSVLSWDDSGNNRAFLAGVISITNNAVSIYNVAKRDAPELLDKTNHALPWKGPAGRFGVGVTISFGIPNYTKNADIAEKYIEFLLDKGNFSTWLGEGTGMHAGVLAAFDNDPFWEKDPRIQGFRDTSKYIHLPGHPGPPTRAAAEIQSKFLIVDMFAKAIQGTPTKEAILWAESEIRKIHQKTA